MVSVRVRVRVRFRVRVRVRVSHYCTVALANYYISSFSTS